jgi:putative ABC transport system permease protein
MLKAYLTTAWRSIIFHRVNNIIKLSGLTIGMSSAFLIFMWVLNEYSFDSYYPDTKNIYHLTSVNTPEDGSVDERTPYLIAEGVGEKIPEVLTLSRIHPSQPTIKTADGIFIE